MNSQNNTLVLNSLNESDVLSQLMTVGVTDTTSTSSPFINTIIEPSPFYTAPAYWITYNGDSTFNKIVVEKAENGFVLKIEGRLYIARNEQDIAKLVVKQFSKKEKN